MVTAHRNNVKTLLLSWPVFLKPDEKFIEHFPTLVPDYGELANHGIGLSDVAKTFRWLHTVASHNLPEKFTPSSAFPLVSMLCGQSLSACRMTTFYSTDCPVLANPGDRGNCHGHGAVFNVEPQTDWYPFATYLRLGGRQRRARRSPGGVDDLQFQLLEVSPSGALVVADQPAPFLRSDSSDRPRQLLGTITKHVRRAASNLFA